MVRRLTNRFRVDPIRVGTLVGAFWAVVVFAFGLAIMVALLLLDTLLQRIGVFDKTSLGFSIFSGLIIAPIMELVGLPWTYLIGRGSLPTFIVGAAIGLPVNGAIVGLLFGLIAKIRHTSNEKD
jgi:nucleoside permease NupC